jgi:hypothetical protein
MAIGHSQTAQDLIRSWRDGNTMGGFFAWLSELGRKDEEVREIVVKSLNCEKPSKWQSFTGNVVEINIDAVVHSLDIEVTFVDLVTAQRQFTAQELMFPVEYIKEP